MIVGVIYSVATGIAQRTVRASSLNLLMLQAREGEAVYQGQFNTEVFWLDPSDGFALKARPLMGCGINKKIIYANGVDQIFIVNLPVGALVVHPEGEFMVEAGDTSLTWACNTAGEYVFRVELEPYQTTEYVVRVMEVP